MFSYQIDKNLRLELPEVRHAEAVAKVVQENLERLKPWMPWAVDDYSVEHAKVWIQRTLNYCAESGRFDALILADDIIAGAIGFHNLNRTNRSAEIGYWAAKEFEGRGMITQCCRLFIDYLFDTIELNRVQINCNVENKRSRAVPERLGFKLEGIHRQAEFLNGKFGDWAIYAMLRSEWKQ